MKYRFAWWRLHFRHELVDDKWKVWDKERVMNGWSIDTRRIYETLSGLKNMGWRQVDVPYVVIEPQRKRNHMGFDPPYEMCLTKGKIRFARKSDVTLFKLMWVQV